MAAAETPTTSRTEAKAHTHAALIAAAEEALFGEGWERSSLEAIAARAGVTKQTLLRHFGSKEGLLEQAWTSGFHHVREQRWRAPTHDLAGAVDNLLDHYEEVGDRAMRLSALGGGEAIAEIGRVGRRLHYDWIDHAFGAWLVGIPAQVAARRRAALIALCDVQTWHIFARDLGLPRPEVRATLLHAIHALVEGES